MTRGVWNLPLNNISRFWDIVLILLWVFLWGFFRINAIQDFLDRYLSKSSHPTQHYVTHPVRNGCMWGVVEIAPQDEARCDESQSHLKNIMQMNNMTSTTRFVRMPADENSKMRKEKAKTWKWTDWKADNITNAYKLFQAREITNDQNTIWCGSLFQLIC